MARTHSPAPPPTPGDAGPDNGGTAGRRVKGRAARSNRSGRYERNEREDFDDGWRDGGAEDPSANRLRTETTVERPRRIINYVESPFVGFDRSINPYRGCEHGCIYCFARPTHAYYGLSAGQDFETKLFAKPDAAKLLEKELKEKSYEPRHIAIGTNTDPYQPIEREYRVMRGVLGVLQRFNHPVSILTKSALIERDLDILGPMAEAGIVRVMLSITTLDPALARAMEPRASAPRRRLDAVRRLAEAGAPTGVMTAPIIPGLNDHELEALIEAAAAAGATFVGYTIVRLPLEVSGLFREWLETDYPDRARKVMRAIREMNGGRDYDPNWTRRVVQAAGATSPGGDAQRSARAQLITARFHAARRRFGLAGEPPPLDPASFRRPVEKGDQLSLFDESRLQ